MTNHMEISQVLFSAAELAASFEVHVSTIRKLYTKGDGSFPERDAEARFNAVEACEWILANTSKRSKLWANANLFLGGIRAGRIPVRPTEPTPPQKKKRNPRKDAPRSPKKKKPAVQVDPKLAARKLVARKAVVDKGDGKAITAAVTLGKAKIKSVALADANDEDFGAILNSFRRTVHESVRLCEQALIEDNEALLQSRLRSSGAAMEQLRKAEQSILDIQLARKSSLPVDEVRVAFVAMASAIKAKLLQLPIKLSHELAGTQTAGEAQTILDEEIRMVLNDLSENPFGAK